MEDFRVDDKISHNSLHPRPLLLLFYTNSGLPLANWTAADMTQVEKPRKHLRNRTCLLAAPGNLEVLAM